MIFNLWYVVVLSANLLWCVVLACIYMTQKTLSKQKQPLHLPKQAYPPPPPPPPPPHTHTHTQTRQGINVLKRSYTVTYVGFFWGVVVKVKQQGELRFTEMFEAAGSSRSEFPSNETKDATVSLRSIGQ